MVDWTRVAVKETTQIHAQSELAADCACRRAMRQENATRSRSFFATPNRFNDKTESSIEQKDKRIGNQNQSKID
jgi:hypothetical protein